MSELLVCHMNGVFAGDVAPTEIDALLADKDNVVWLDIRDPNEQDITLLREEFEFHPLAIEDAVRQKERPKIDAYDGYYFIVFYAINYRTDERNIELQPLHLFVGRNYLVSVHRGEFRQVQETITRWRAPNSPLGNNVGALLYALLDSIVDDYFPLADHISERIDDLEDEIFQRRSTSAIQKIFQLKRQLLNVRRVIAPERDVLNVLLRREMPIFGERDLIYLQDIYDHIVRITDSVDAYRELLASALDGHLSLQSNKLNEILKVLTITSIILMSDALIAGIYGMNFQFMPELAWPYGYPFALGLMATVSVGLILFFRYKKWL
jgi:magnesium transporter